MTDVGPDGYAYDHRNPWAPTDLRGTPGEWYKELAEYYGICERLDEYHGQLLAAPDDEGILDH